MKRRLILFCCCCFYGQIQAQLPEQVVAYATYQYSHITDTTNRMKVYQEEMLLRLGPHVSAFSSASLLQIKGEFDKNPTIKTDIHGTTMIQAKADRYFDPKELFLFHSERKFFVTEKIVNTYLYEIDYPQIYWSISDDTKIIKGLKCQQATTDYQGRTWIVWFCEDIPFSAGPWQLCGLPGLIVSASDSNNEVHFDLTAFGQTLHENYLSSEKLSISIPENTEKTPIIKTDRQSIERLWEAFNKNPEQLIMTQIRAANMLIHDPISMESLLLRPVINNTIAR